MGMIEKEPLEFEEVTTEETVENTSVESETTEDAEK